MANRMDFFGLPPSRDSRAVGWYVLAARRLNGGNHSGGFFDS